jgi:hypothetical protein
MRAEILCCFLARHQYRTVSVTADWNVLRVALWSELQHVCTEHLTSRSGREGIFVETSTYMT